VQKHCPYTVMTSGVLRCLYPSTVTKRRKTSDICWTNELNKDDFLAFQYSNRCSMLSPQAFLIQKDSNHNFPADDTLMNLFYMGISCGYVPQDAALNWVQNGGPYFQFPLTIRQETHTSGVILGTVTIAFLVSLCVSVSIQGMKRAKTL